VLIDSKFSTVICAPVYSSFEGLSTQVSIGIDEGLKHESSIYCDGLISIPKKKLTHYIGTLSEDKILELDCALARALALEQT
jgi:mRNA interferase MazF